ncbi:hypothetical protein BaRGS_00030656 [Batillaria attramentaria]|uniref:Uncharacterized protein n=1 Tax=Batillaria attramentaria TaxID=370345 RepID=A0ABD0JTM9_9CAEN
MFGTNLVLSPTCVLVSQSPRMHQAPGLPISWLPIQNKQGRERIWGLRQMDGTLTLHPVESTINTGSKESQQGLDPWEPCKEFQAHRAWRPPARVCVCPCNEEMQKIRALDTARCTVGSWRYSW